MESLHYWWVIRNRTAKSTKPEDVPLHKNKRTTQLLWTCFHTQRAKGSCANTIPFIVYVVLLIWVHHGGWFHAPCEHSLTWAKRTVTLHVHMQYERSQDLQKKEKSVFTGVFSVAIWWVVGHKIGDILRFKGKTFWALWASCFFRKYQPKIHRPHIRTSGLVDNLTCSHLLCAYCTSLCASAVSH